MTKKRALCIAVCFLALLLDGCKAKEQDEMTVQNDPTVTFINGVQEADVWILPATEQNLKTTVWGTATAAKVQKGERREAPLCEPGDGGQYLLRMIDTEHFYYSASGITLRAGWTMEVKGDDLHSVTLEVTDENGVLNNTYKVFAARL